MLGYFGGEFNGVTVANGTVTLTASATNYVVANRTTGAVTAATNTTNWLDTTNYMQLYQLVAGTASFTIAATSDKRQAYGGASSSGGMTNPMTTTGDIIYSSSGSTPARLAASTNGYVLTLAAGIPTWAASSSGFANPMTTVGDLIVGSTGGTAVRYAASTSGHVLTSNGAGAAPTWQAPASGFANPMTTTGDIIYATSGSTPGRLGVGSNGQVLTLAGGVPTWAAAPGGGGLTNWTESVTIAVPNASVPAVRFIATNAAAAADAVLSAKGVGAILAQVPDNTATGGNKRGTDAIDWQKSRNNAANVASGANAVISGGYDNRASNTYSAVIGGATNISSGSASTAGGSNSTASGANSFAIGFAGTASGDTSFACGSGGIADAIYSMVTGRNARTRGITAVHAFSSGNVSSAGDVQARRLHVFCNTTDATLKALTAGGAAASATNNIAIPTAGAAAFRAIVCAKQLSAGTDCKSWEVTGLIKNPAGTISFVGTPTVTVIAADTGAAAWTLTVAADNTLKVLRLDATGAAATGIYWSGVIEVAEVLN